MLKSQFFESKKVLLTVCLSISILCKAEGTEIKSGHSTVTQLVTRNELGVGGGEDLETAQTVYFGFGGFGSGARREKSET